jgi:hypothetical protein
MVKKKRTSKKRQQQKRPARPLLKVGDAVRVKDGVMDPDYEEQCLGGWTGTIMDIDRDSDPPLVLIAWDKKTLTELIGVEVLARASQQNLDAKVIWLALTEVERADLAQSTQLPQPAKLGAQLRAGHGEPATEVDEADRRIARLFGLAEDEEPPEVTEETLEVYYEHLRTCLRFPFDGEYTRETGPLQDTAYAITVTGLADVEDGDAFYGLLCEGRQGRRHVVVPLAEVDVDSDTLNFQLIDDYQTWFWNNR